MTRPSAPPLSRFWKAPRMLSPNDAIGLAKPDTAEGIAHLHNKASS